MATLVPEGFFFFLKNKLAVKQQHWVAKQRLGKKPSGCNRYEIDFQTIGALWHLVNILFLVTNHRQYNLNDDINLINVLPLGIVIKLSQLLFKDYRNPANENYHQKPGDLKVNVVAVTTRGFLSCLILGILCHCFVANIARRKRKKLSGTRVYHGRIKW